MDSCFQFSSCKSCIRGLFHVSTYSKHASDTSILPSVPSPPRPPKTSVPRSRSVIIRFCSLFAWRNLIVFFHATSRLCRDGIVIESSGCRPSFPSSHLSSYLTFSNFSSNNETGASTAPTPPSARLPKPPADLAHLYLLALLEGKLKSKEISEKVPRFFVSIRSLSDRNVCCRCPLPMDVGSDGDDKNTGIKIYVSPGYGGGVFVVANPSFGVGGVCARIWRGTFDEGRYYLEDGVIICYMLQHTCK